MDTWNFWVDKETTLNIVEMIDDLNFLAQETGLQEKVATVELTREGGAWVSLNTMFLASMAEHIIHKYINPSRVVQIPGQMKMLS